MATVPIIEAFLEPIETCVPPLPAPYPQGVFLAIVLGAPLLSWWVVIETVRFLSWVL